MKIIFKIIFAAVIFSGVYMIPANVEAAAKQIYYSVGQNTNDHKTGSPTVTISDGVATFSVAQTASNIGVGDRVTYSGNQKVFISSKISQTKWTVVTVKGDTPANVTNATVNSIRHEFDSLNNAVSYYKGFQAGDSSHLNTSNLVSGNYILNIPLYYDTGPEYFTGGGIYAGILISGSSIVTGPNNYIRIYTPTNTASEVNQSQRHDGKWNNQKYSLIFSPNNNSTAAIRTYKPYVKIDGLQIKVISNNDGNYGIEASYIDNGWVEFSNNIITGQILNYASGIYVGYADTNVSARIWNNLIYDLQGTAGPGSSTGIIYGSCYNISCVSGTGYLYNNTIVNIPYGIANNSPEAAIVAKNNIVQDATIGYYSHAYNGYFGPASTNNISHHKNGNKNDAPGSNPQNNTAVSFVDKAGKDFHLSPSDTKAVNKGVSLISDPYLPISSDFESDSRPSDPSWDIGADELFVAPKGNIAVSAKLDGAQWSGNIAYSLTGPEAIDGTSVPNTFLDKSAEAIYTLTYVSGGPAGAILDSAQPISPISSQFLPSGASVAFNINFVSPSSCGNGVIDTGEDCDVGPTDPVAWWKFDDGSPNATAADFSGNGNTGTLTNMNPATDWVTGQIGQALDFDGNNDYVNAGAPATLNNLPALSISAWIKPDSLANPGNVIATKAHGEHPEDAGWVFYLENESGNKKTLQFEADFNSYAPFSSFGDLWAVAEDNVIKVGEWNHVVVTWDGSNIAANAKFYVNGVLVGKSTHDNKDINGIGSRGDDSSRHLIIGDDPQPYNVKPFDGLMDDVRIYNRVLSAAEIGNLSSQGLGGETCQSRGFGEGTLSCEPATCSFNESQCLSSGADLVGRTLGINGDLVPGQSITFSINALNQSNNNASGPSTLRICIDNANCATSAAGSLGEFLIPALGENENSTLFTSNTWSMDTSAHTYYACADVYGTNAETNEANNCGSQAFTATECSDENDNSDPEDTLADFGSDPGCADIYDDNETDSNEFSLNASGPIIATIVGGGLSNSTKTTITVTPDAGFSGDVKLTLDSGQPLGTVPLFMDKDAGPLDLDLREDYITPAEYSVGSFFKVRVPQDTSYGTYNLSIKGKSGSIERYITVPLRVEVRGPGYFEVLREPFKFFSLFEPIDLLGFMSSI